MSIPDILNAPLGQMSSTAYDTAWIALLDDIDVSLSNTALTWLEEHQLPDGSWGAEAPMYYHDRVACTLAAMLALVTQGRRATDKKAIARGLLALESITSNATRGLMVEANGATAGFELIIPTLVKQAEQLGIIKQQGDRILGRLSKARHAKLAKLSGMTINRNFTSALSAEIAGKDYTTLLDTENLQEANGSVANSPSATAYYCTVVKPADERALNYIRKIIRPDGGAPFVAPFEHFELAWMLWNLSMVSDPDSQKLCRQKFDSLLQSWRPGCGIGFSATYSVCDGDDTAVVYELAARLGLPGAIDIESLLGFEENDHFRCFPLESSPSIDVNIHVIEALRSSGMDAKHPTMQKVVEFIRKNRIDHKYWLDKWNVSPFYTTAHAVICCSDIDDSLCEESIKWILREQHADGSWGFYMATAEETAFCLQALCFWRRKEKQVGSGRIELGARWLEEHANDPLPPLWIGKALYCPELLVQSAIRSALALAGE